MSKIFALVDCNNFYASCERLFNPALEKRPIVVLSNNDGCVVARSNEAKSLGIKMATPIFKCQDIIRKHDVKVFSSNYQLYGDMSQRVMECLASHALDIEVYSIDEAFLRLDKMLYINPYDYCLYLKRIIYQWTGIPVSIGISTTKTLTKVANLIAKKDSSSGVFSLLRRDEQTKALASIKLEDVWGISSRRVDRLNNLGIYDVLQLRRADLEVVRKNLSVVGEKICLELRGQSCLDLEATKGKKSIGSAKSFGKPIVNLDELDEALATYVARVAEKLRAQKSLAQAMHVFLKTNRFKLHNRQYKNSVGSSLLIPTDNTSELIKTARYLLGKIYVKGFSYHKVGVLLLDLVSHKYRASSLFEEFSHTKSDNLMKAIDLINNKSGSETVFFATQGVKKSWRMKTNYRSPRYTTNWNEIPLVS